jgi:hypothetical protein
MTGEHDAILVHTVYVYAKYFVKQNDYPSNSKWVKLRV